MGLRDSLANFAPFPSLGDEPPTLESAQALIERYGLTNIMRIKAFDNAEDVMYIDEGDRISVAATFEFLPLLSAGEDTERQISMLIKDMPPGSTMQFGILGWPDVYNELNQWYWARTKNAERQIFIDMAKARLDHYARSLRGLSLTREGDLYPRDFRCYLSLYFPGPKTNEEARFERFMRDTMRRIENLKGKMDSSQMKCKQLNELEVLRLYRLIYNPNLSPEELDNRLGRSMGKMNGRMPTHVQDKGTRIRVTPGGDVEFSGDGQLMLCRPMTVDMYPDTHYLFEQRRLVGDILDGSSRVSAPFWAYTNMVALDPQNSQDQLMAKLGIMNKQTLSESAWFRSMLGGLIHRRDETQNIIELVKGEPSLVRAYSGINIYATPDRIEDHADATRSLWNKAGFQCSRERFITLPVFMASNPSGYSPKIDPPNKGLQRSEMMTTLNAATLSFCASDWPGTSIDKGGPLLVSRRGQIASIDFFQSDGNYNFAVAASSGSGKSFFCNEICIDYLSRNGLVRIIDVGRSYEKLGDLIDGQLIEYDLEKPQSINPFWGMRSVQELNELLPMLKKMLLLMAYPTNQPPAWEHQAMESIVRKTWENVGEELGLKDIYRAMQEHSDPRAHDLADQIESYAVGRLAAWFNGPKEISFDNDFCILELEGLNADKELRNVIFALTIHSISRDMYRSHAHAEATGGVSRPKLLLIDEAWDLMGSSSNSESAREFIEEAARRIRKYEGSLGTITQSYGDYYESSAAQAALDNSDWRITLAQKPGSLGVAKDKKVFADDDELTWKLLASLKRGSDYSEIHIANNDVGEVFRFFVDPLSYWIYTTRPSDKNRIVERAHANGISKLEAIYEIAQEDIEQLDMRLAEVEAASLESSLVH